MLMTEEEARKQTCPLIRFCVNDSDVLQHGCSAIHVHQTCQASDCKVGWRWQRTTRSPPTAVPAGAIGLAAALQPPTYERGYCGAFGVPT